MPIFVMPTKKAKENRVVLRESSSISPTEGYS